MFYEPLQHLGCPDDRRMSCLAHPEDLFLDLRQPLVPDLHGEIARACVLIRRMNLALVALIRVRMARLGSICGSQFRLCRLDRKTFPHADARFARLWGILAYSTLAARRCALSHSPPQRPSVPP